MRSVYITTREFVDGRDTKIMNSRKQAVGRARKAPLFGQALESKVELVSYGTTETCEEIELRRTVVYRRDFTAPSTPATEKSSTIAHKAASFGFGNPIY